MTVENNWIKHNLLDRVEDHSTKFKVEITPNRFRAMDFHQASNYTALQIANRYDKLFLSFSGGADSDYVFHCLKRNKIDFVPILVESNFNKVELSYAYHTCRKFNVTPTVIKLSDKDFISTFDKEVIEKINGVGIAAVPGIFSCRYAKENNGTLIIGEHMIDNDEKNIWPGMNEWDFYNEIFVGDEYNIPFFNYTTELAWAMINRIEQEPIDEWKWKLYELDYRPIISYQFSYLFDSLLKKLYNKRKFGKPSADFPLGSKEEFLSQLSNYKY